MKKISIIIPAYNEEQRIKKTLEAYSSFFDQLKQGQILDYELLVVLNGCKDNTIGVVKEVSRTFGNILIIDLLQAGKGLAIIEGFTETLKRDSDFIGFVDADMATEPDAFYELIKHIDPYDGIIASRYMRASRIYPPRPPIKEWGRRLIYNPMVCLLFGLYYADMQCGAKIFKRKVIELITPHLQELRWAFDVELLYLCKKFGFVIKELPTVWTDQELRKFKLVHSGLPMIQSLFKLRLRYSVFSRWVK